MDIKEGFVQDQSVIEVYTSEGELIETMEFVNDFHVNNNGCLTIGFNVIYFNFLEYLGIVNPEDDFYDKEVSFKVRNKIYNRETETYTHDLTTGIYKAKLIRESNPTFFNLSSTNVMYFELKFETQYDIISFLKEVK